MADDMSSTRKRKLDADDRGSPLTGTLEPDDDLPSVAAQMQEEEAISGIKINDLRDFLKSFPKPVGTLKAWEAAMETAVAASDHLFEVLRSGNPEALDPNDLMKRQELDDCCQRLGMTLNWDKLDELSDTQSPSVDLSRKLCVFDHCIKRSIENVVTKLFKTRDILKGYATFSNKTEVKTKTANAAVENALSADEYARMMSGVHIASPVRSQKEFTNFMVSSDVIEPWWHAKIPVAVKLEAFAAHYNRLIRDSKKVDKMTEAEGAASAKSVTQWEDDGKSSSGTIFPSASASEKNGVQPVLGRLLGCLSQIPEEDGKKRRAHADGEAEENDEPFVRTDIRRERYIAAVGVQPKRYVDFESKLLGPFTPVLLHQEISLAKEGKNVRRKHESAQKMLEQGAMQVIGHLGKRTMIAYDVADVGIDSVSVGVVITPIYIQVIRMDLKNMGTENVSVELHKTRLFPLVHKDAFKKLVEDPGDNDYLSPLLFPEVPEDEREDEAAPSIPLGIQHLWELLHSSDADLQVLFFDGQHQAHYIKHDTEDDSEDGNEHAIGALLGSGSQGLVYALTDSVVKSSVVGEKNYIEREIMALRELSTEACNYTPQLQDIGRIRYSIRGASVDVPAFRMTPRGVSATERFRMMEPAAKTMELLKLWSHGKNALTFAHRHNVYHLDVCPRNFIFHDDRYVLIDWGCAAIKKTRLKDMDLKGFRGSLPFAHAGVHAKSNTQSWFPKPEHDVAPLWFTICAFHEGNTVPWPGFNARVGTDTEVVAERRKRTKESLEKLIQGYQTDKEGISMDSLPRCDARFSVWQDFIDSGIKDA